MTTRLTSDTKLGLEQECLLSRSHSLSLFEKYDEVGNEIKLAEMKSHKIIIKDPINKEKEIFASKMPKRQREVFMATLEEKKVINEEVTDLGTMIKKKVDNVKLELDDFKNNIHLFSKSCDK